MEVLRWRVDVALELDLLRFLPLRSARPRSGVSATAQPSEAGHGLSGSDPGLTTESPASL